jgi:phospholipase C
MLFGCLTAALMMTASSAVLAQQNCCNAGGPAPTQFNPPTKTPIKHIVVIFQENISYDHYFGTYPVAMNLPGEAPFTSLPGTPLNNNLLTPLDPFRRFTLMTGVDLLHFNPNASPTAPGNGRVNGAAASNPFRLASSQAATSDQGHNEGPEQSAYDNGKMDGFPAWTGTAGPPPAGIASTALVMGYFDGNTVTALWNYAQFFAMNDNSYSTQFGPSSPGAVNLIAGQTAGVSATLNVFGPTGNLLHATHEAFSDATQSRSAITLIGDGDPLGDVCSNPTIDQVQMAGQNIGNLLSAKGITWGFFEGGFDLTITNANGSQLCNRFTVSPTPGIASASTDYIPHHQPFQYFASTANLTHARPSSVVAIGQSFVPGTSMPEPASHQYDSHDFFDALNAGNMPAVTFLKAPAFQDGHPGYSDPLSEQTFLVNTINAIQQSPFWSSTAIVILYDDSDGWYDHQMPPIVNPSFNPALDTLNGPGNCSFGNAQLAPVQGAPLNSTFGSPAWGRCGYGTRQPLMVISPYAKKNYIDHTLTDQTSVLKFIEDNWLQGARIQPGGSMDTIAGTIENMFDFVSPPNLSTLILNPATGAPAGATPTVVTNNGAGPSNGR